MFYSDFNITASYTLDTPYGTTHHKATFGLQMHEEFTHETEDEILAILKKMHPEYELTITEFEYNCYGYCEPVIPYWNK